MQTGNPESIAVSHKLLSYHIVVNIMTQQLTDYTNVLCTILTMHPKMSILTEDASELLAAAARSLPFLLSHCMYFKLWFSFQKRQSTIVILFFNWSQEIQEQIELQME